MLAPITESSLSEEYRR